MNFVFNILSFLGLASCLLPVPIRESIFSNYRRKYPISRYTREYYSRNQTLPSNPLNDLLPKSEKIASDNEDEDDDESEDIIGDMIRNALNNNSTQDLPNPFKKHTLLPGGVRIVMDKQTIMRLSQQFQQANNGDNQDDDEDDEDDERDFFGRPMRRNKKSENFEVVKKSGFCYKDVGGYDNIKQELNQCIDILSNFTKYAPYNVRVPKGLILEGPPGNGKTLLAKALAGEAKCSFIAVSGSEFQDKYVGVGAGRIRELFSLAKDNVPCIIFIDEIDALGRKRSGDGETSGNERDNTLNELLVALDGFKNTSGVFVIGATNRADLLDNALMRPGRIDKRIFIGNPDTSTRRAILNIHSKGKPNDETVVFDDVVELTKGLSGAEIENLLNEAMLYALRYDKKQYSIDDIDNVLDKMMVGWQPNEHQYTNDIIDQIAIHELGHAVVGLLAKHHSKMTKIVINLSSPKNPAYTIFEGSSDNIMTRESLFEHLMILLAGRIAEEVFYGVSVSTGAINDFEEALKLAERMVCYYGMGKKLIYPSTSEKYKEMIDDEVSSLIHEAYGYSEFIVRNSKELIAEGSRMLKENKVLKAEQMIQLMNEKYQSILCLKI